MFFIAFVFLYVNAFAEAAETSSCIDSCDASVVGPSDSAAQTVRIGRPRN
jgi:hypothetical protein